MSINHLTLDNKVHEYTKDLRDRVVMTRQFRNVTYTVRGKVKNKTKLVWDYPAVASACTDSKIIRAAFSAPMTVCNGKLQNEIEKYGNMGQEPDKAKIKLMENGNHYPLGQCAEQHAASKVLTDSHSANLTDLTFSVALKVRDDVIMPACGNCKTLFPKLK